MKANDIPILFFENSQDFEEWMEKNHEKVDAIWVKFAKKSSGITSINYRHVPE